MLPQPTANSAEKSDRRSSRFGRCWGRRRQPKRIIEVTMGTFVEVRSTMGTSRSTLPLRIDRIWAEELALVRWDIVRCTQPPVVITNENSFFESWIAFGLLGLGQAIKGPNSFENFVR